MWEPNHLCLSLLLLSFMIHFLINLVLFSFSIKYLDFQKDILSLLISMQSNTFICMTINE